MVVALDHILPGVFTGDHPELYHYLTPLVCIIVSLFLVYGLYVFRSDFRLKAPKKQVNRNKAWALFLKFDRRGKLKLNYEDMTCFMSIVNTEGKLLRTKDGSKDIWDMMYYQRMCEAIDIKSDVAVDGLPFEGFLLLYHRELLDCEENYTQVFESERTEYAKSQLEEDPVENITAVQFATIDPKFTGRCGQQQFNNCFQASCEAIGIPEPHDEWYPLAFQNFDLDKDGMLGYNEFHSSVRQYLDHCRAVKANIENPVHIVHP